MANQQYEYRVEPVSISPTELQDERRKINEILNEYASEGWELIDSIRIDSSSLLFVFYRPTDS
ncbi:DUF4177 domain-containing protein [Haladaptatus salinisoli]|uniref:DUF4177 domain-containing protein n=1 Tax=Haladaptatus salinisoli TaxID=2884876 RepID=UPI001D0B22AD|nr:DUF4177 domain-containing protein [Haladaptatus salinisoli]